MTVMIAVVTVTHIYYLIIILKVYKFLQLININMSEAEKAKVVPLTETQANQDTSNGRKIPQAIFIENTEAWVEKYTSDTIIAQMNELYQKYKFMEA